jgi:hypothetical protein
VLVTGGLNAVCNPCAAAVHPRLTVTLTGASPPLFARNLTALAATGGPDATGASISEIVVTPTVCGPCTYQLALTVPAPAGGGANSIAAGDIRLGLVDLGLVAG